MLFRMRSMSYAKRYNLPSLNQEWSESIETALLG